MEVAAVAEVGMNQVTAAANVANAVDAADDFD